MAQNNQLNQTWRKEDCKISQRKIRTKDGATAKALEASGLAGLTEALPGVSEKTCEGSLLVQENLSPDPLVAGLADGLSAHLALQIRNPFLQAFTYNSTSYLMLEFSQFVFDGLSGFTAGNTLGFSIAQLKVRN